MRVAVVGCGRWGRNHLRNYAELGALAGVVDRNREEAARQAASFGAPVLSLEEVLQDPAIDGVVLALPPSQNLPIGREVLGAGKHLFVEKPLALSVRDGEELSGLAEAAGRPLAVGHILRYHPAFTALQELVAAGRLGRILSVTSSRLDLGRIRREEDALWALAPHDISMVLALLGSGPARIEAWGGFHTHPTIADTASVSLDFEHGVRAEIRSSWLNPLKEQRLTVVGSQAMAVFDDREPWDRKLTLHPYSMEENPGRDPSLERGDPIAIPVPPGEPLRLQCEHVLHCIASGARPRTDGEEAVRVLRVLERASQAMGSR